MSLFFVGSELAKILDLSVGSQVSAVVAGSEESLKSISKQLSATIKPQMRFNNSRKDSLY